ncbi:RICIN domain-containing protein [Kitasatospora purpeofusca]|uniref:RICIN domain-containing protein n=1 Tax=Kitasatospora purpeofusca TaxID=67352 RepID=UPI0030F1D56D
MHTLPTTLLRTRGRPARRPARAAAALVTLLIAAAGLAPVQTAAAAPTVRHVATTGNDSASGTAAAPFRTIQRCAEVAVAGDTCLIGAGTYRETVTPRASGQAGAPITFAAAPGARVTVDGTDPVTGWVRDTGQVYKAPVRLAGTPAAPYGSTKYPGNEDLWANQVFTGGALVPEAAYPAATSDPWQESFITGGWQSTRSGSPDTCSTPPCTAVLTGTLTYDRFPALGDMTGATVYLAGGWVANSASVTGGTLDGGNKVLQLRFPASDRHVVLGGGNSTKFRVVGKKSLLRGPNAWYYDPAEQQLYLWAPNGAAPENVTAKRRNYGFDLNGRSHITVRGIGLHATSVTTDDGSSQNVLDGITAEYTSTWQTTQFDSNLPYAGIYDANHHSDSGILLHGTGNVIRNSVLRFSMGNGLSVKGSGHVVTNNLIRDVAYGGTYTAAVALEVGSRDVTITNNTMRSTGRDVINMNTNAYPNDGYRNIRIAYNEMTDYAKINYDLGAVYTCCNTAYTGTRIDHNWIHDPAQIGNGFHFDNGSYDLNADHNVIWNLRGGTGVSFGGFVESGKDLPYLKGNFTANTIVSAGNSTIFQYYANKEHVANLVLRNNILDGSRRDGKPYDHINGGTPDQSNNLITTRSKDGGLPDPKYRGAGTGDFTLAPGSPALDAGVPVAGVTDGHTGAAPDQGAYETGQAAWVPGCTFDGCGAAVGKPAVLVGTRSGKAVGLQGAGAARSAVQQTLGTAAGQQFTVAPVGGGEVRLVDREAGQCLAPAGGSSADGTPVRSVPCGNDAAQRWTVADTVLGFRRLVSGAGGKCLDVEGASTDEGARLILWPCGPQLNQQWTVVNVSTG